MPELFDRESKPKFNFPGLYDRSMPVISEVTPAPKEAVEPEPKKIGRPRKAVSAEPVSSVSAKKKSLKLTGKKE